jgi:hypothetical protein
LLLVLATWWRRKMTGWTWWLQLLAMMVIAWGICMISGLGVGSGNQAAINTAVIFFLIFYTNYAIALPAILLGWGIDYFLNRNRQQGAND